MAKRNILKSYGLVAIAGTSLLSVSAAATQGLPPLQSLTPPPLPAPFNGKPVEGLQPSAPPAPPNNPKPIHAELNDGTQVEFDLDGSVWILNKDGSKDPAPDGILTLKDGVTFNVKNGNRVDE
jgi:hypothetical protein